MQTRDPSKPVPTEELLGPWSLTALAALLVAGGAWMLLPGKQFAPDSDGGAAYLHAAPDSAGAPARSGVFRAPVNAETAPGQVSIDLASNERLPDH